ncbi:MAG TPA: hypothetical protein VIM73_21115 [Polyangiaceae bacterium]
MRAPAVVVAFPVHRTRRQLSREVFAPFTELNAEARVPTRLFAAGVAALAAVCAFASALTHF